jgi:hypothetical protein
MPTFRKLIPFIILLAAFALRAWQLTEIPPGMTHDEAGHGHDAAYVLKGVTPIYFPVGYGREPLFDYFNAGLIFGLGANVLTLRFSAVIWSLIALAVTYRLTRTLFGWQTATLALALMVSAFWPLATSRQILRSAMMPAEMAIAAWLFVKLSREEKIFSKWLLVIGLGVVIAASLYTYLPARIMWLMFPLTALAFWFTVPRDNQQRVSNHQSLITFSLAAVAIGFALASPLFIYLSEHPEVDQRVGTLSGPLNALQNGDFTVLLNNAWSFLLALFLPGYGDSFLAYNIPGQPIYDPVTFIFFVIGIAVLVAAMFRPATNTLLGRAAVYAPLLLLWLGLGLAPSLITGPEALTTRIIAGQPMLYIIPALGIVVTAQWLLPKLRARLSRFQQRRWDLDVLGSGIIAIWVLLLANLTAQNYFIVWGNSPDVRAAYQSTLVEMLKTVNGPTVISTVYPSAPHDPYIGELYTTHETRWVDGRLAVILRAETDETPLQLLAPASTPLHPFLASFYQQRVKVNVRPDDLDPYFILYQPLTFQETDDGQARPVLNEAVELRGSGWLAETYKPGDVAELFTGWRVLDPAKLGPIHPPAFKTDLNLFAHILNPDGSIFLQQDRLDAPSWDWQAGDTILQVYPFAIPADAVPGEYTVEVGFYDRPSGERLTTSDGADHILIAPLVIQAP